MKDSQRRAMFAKMNNTQLRSRGIILKPNKDTDKDGVINKNDCRPLNPTQQGFFHDMQVKRLKRIEEKLETKREHEQKKLEDIKDRLNEKRAVANKGLGVKRIQLKQKQAIIDEIKREKEQASILKEANKQTSAELDKYTTTGKIKRGAKFVGSRLAKGSVEVLKDTGQFLKGKKAKKIFKSIFG